jgi:ornithine cyclodeaminase/alanine dehydrogenase-like protein (mu-crystallin family)
LADRSLGRHDSDQVTVYKSTGHAVQDIAAAHVVLDAAIEGDIGTVVEL